MRFAQVLSIAVLCGASHLEAQHPRQTDFSPLEFLVGSCWIGTFPNSEKTDEHCFEWMFDRKFIRDRHVIRGGTPYEGETIYGRDPATKQLAFWYWNSAGQLITGRVEPARDSIVFPSRYTTDKGEVELHTVWTRIGEVGYRVTNSQRVGTGWKVLWSMDMMRKR